MDRGPAQDSYLSSVIGLLWPEPAHVSAPRRLSRNPTNRGSDYLVLPSAAKPKLVIPSRPRRVAAGAVRNFKTASSAKEQFFIGSLAVALRLGLADLLPDRLRVEYDSGVARVDIEAHLSTILGRRVYVSLYIGPPRAVRKPVLQLLDERGATFAFAKVGVDRFTRDLVKAEATSVTALSAVQWSVLSVPTVLAEGAWHGHELLVQTAFPRGRGVQPGSVKLSRAMNELARVNGVRVATLAHSPYWRRLVGRVQSLPPSEFTAVLQRAVASIESSSGGTQLEFGAWHGDWTPWNMTVAADRVMVWDWEKFESGVPIGFDAVHFEVQRSVVMTATAPVLAFSNAMDRAAHLLQAYGPNGQAALLVVWLYAADIAVRYLRDREMDGATRMGNLSSWVAAVLDAAALRMLRP